jgi:uncharacterized protein YndB with AHSA1/START domain
MTQPSDDRALLLTRSLRAPRAALWRCWTEPELLKQWFCPKPWRVSRAEVDVRPGGSSRIVMNGPNGEAHDLPGVYLDVVPLERLVFTDAFKRAWEPSGKAFMVGAITFADEPGGTTRYHARVSHWSEEDKTAHEAMGFHEGWGVCADQLEALAASL